MGVIEDDAEAGAKGIRDPSWARGDGVHSFGLLLVEVSLIFGHQRITPVGVPFESRYSGLNKMYKGKQFNLGIWREPPAWT